MYELWLAGERQRQRRRVLSFLRELSLDAFALGDQQLAIRTANELVMLEPFDEGHHALLIRTLALSGDRAAAQNQFERCAILLRSELDAGPGPAVLAAARLAAPKSDLASKPEFDEVFARMIVAWQSFLSGAIDHGLDMSRSAVALADAHRDVTLRITGRLFLAAMLNMSVRAWDEAAMTTAAAHRLASDTQRTQDQAMARSILAGSELMRGDYRAALVHSQTGAAMSDDSGTCALNLAASQPSSPISVITRMRWVTRWPRSATPRSTLIPYNWHTHTHTQLTPKSSPVAIKERGLTRSGQ